MRPIYLFDGLDPEIVRWVRGQIPEGGSVADVVRGIITDAYYDEKGE